MTWPNLDIETGIWNAGYRFIAGIDEVGRGTLAGPVVSSAVVLDPVTANTWQGLINDSKQMIKKARNNIYEKMLCESVQYGVGSSSSSEIDDLGIVSATRLSMIRAVQALESQPEFLLIDSEPLENLKIPQKSLIKGDTLSLSIAAASIIAKVIRDQIMTNIFDVQFPKYGFAKHKGYGTKLHMDALQKFGPCEIHRRSFRPIREIGID